MHLQSNFCGTIHSSCKCLQKPSHEDLISKPHRSKRVHRHCNTKHRDKARTLRTKTKEVPQKSTTGSRTVPNFMEKQFQRCPQKFKSTPQTCKDDKFQTVWQLFPKTSTSVQIQFKLHGKQFQEQWTTHRTTTSYDPQLLGYLIWQVVISIPLQLHHWIIRVP